MDKIKVIYGTRQVSDPGLQPISQKGYTPSPSANKPQEVARVLEGVEFVDPDPLTREDFKLVHDAGYVDGVMDLRLPNGFGTISQSVVDSLPYTNGAMYTALRLATPTGPTCALVSGFHHAGYAGWEDLGWFCTFNGLMIAAAKANKKVAIIDCDMHWGNGTDDILTRLPHLKKSVEHLTFGKYFTTPRDAKEYLSWLERGGRVYRLLSEWEPEVIIFQAGADVHVNDPYGGVLNTGQIYERDLMMFGLAKHFGIPLAWNLAGGYQTDPDGGISKVLEIHLNTFKACREVYGK